MMRIGRMQCGRSVSLLAIVGALGLVPVVAGALPVRSPDSPNPPTISGAPVTTATVGALYEFRPAASDADGDPLSFSVSNKPKWLAFDQRTGRLSGTPAAGDRGVTRTITVNVTDGTYKVALPGFAIAVGSDGVPSIGGVPATAVVEGEFYAFVPQASDPEGARVTFQVKNKPSWATFTRSNGLLSGIPAAGTAGSYSDIVVGVTDGQTVVWLPAFSITVKPMGNQTPVIYGVPANNVEAGSSYAFQPNASDPEGSPLRFAVTNLPPWASFDTTSGRLAGTPQPSHAGTYSNIVISASDGLATSSLAPFSVNVTATNRVPVVSGTPVTVATAGQPYMFVPTASDPDGQALRFSVSGKPGWAAFDPATGALSGTPTDAEVATYSNIVVSVSDGEATVALPAFSITVDKAVTGWASLSWVPPTENVDGTPITNLAGYRIRYGQSAASLDRQLEIPTPTVTGATIESLSSGVWYFAVTAYTAANVESELSNLAQKTIQ